MKTLFKMIIVICGVSLVIPFSSFAAQFDAPYYVLQEKNKDKWAAEDEQIDAKLRQIQYAKLEQDYFDRLIKESRVLISQEFVALAVNRATEIYRKNQ